MKYISTHGAAPELTFKQALPVRLAEDGGLYVPKSWPEFTTGEIPDADFQITNDAYDSFHHLATVPLVRLGANDWLLELFHCPTLTFKEVAMQILARLMDYILTERGMRLAIAGASSGANGISAFKAFNACESIDTLLRPPHGMISDFQRYQITTIGAENYHAVDGRFNDCQSIVKAMFAHENFRDQLKNEQEAVEAFILDRSWLGSSEMSEAREKT